MEARVEMRKQEIIGKERTHIELKGKADVERQRLLNISSTEKEMKMYTRQLKMARHQRRDEYRREVVSAKIQMEGDRTESLLKRRQDLLARRKDMRSNNSLARQAVAERIDKMRQSSSFDIDPEMRSYIHNPDLRELLDRCDTTSGGGGKVSLDAMRAVLGEMQSEGKLQSIGGSSSHEKPARSQSASAL
jgi:hypothetical protein